MATGDDTQKLPIHQQQYDELVNSIKSRLGYTANRIKFLLDLLGHQPDKPLVSQTNYLEAELVSLLNDLEGIQGLYEQQYPDAPELK